VFFLPGDLFNSVAALARGFIGLDAGAMWGVIGDIHRSATAGLGASKMFMLKGLDKAALILSFLF
jgi:hypothetical protein